MLNSLLQVERPRHDFQVPLFAQWFRALATFAAAIATATAAAIATASATGATTTATRAAPHTEGSCS